MKIPKTQRSDLPEEMMEEILLRLDVQWLLRFRCVSKSYRSLIDSKRFIKIHHQRSTRDATLAHHSVLFFSDTNSSAGEAKASRCSLVSFLDNPDFHNYNLASKLNIFPTNLPPYRTISVLGCCNGLVCILLHTNMNSLQFILWNPSTRISKKLPELEFNKQIEYIACCGFGWDEWSDDYKVIITVTVDKSPGISIAKLYSLKSDSWKQIDGWDIKWVPFKFGVLASGKLHWVSVDSVRPRKQEIVAFDLKREVFESLPCYSGGHGVPYLGTFGECLAVLCLYEDLITYINDYREIRVMKKRERDYSWEKAMFLHDNCANGVIWTCPSLPALCNSATRENVLMNFNYDTTYLAYDLKNNCIRCPYIPYPGELTDPNFIYVESLISPFRV